MPIFKNLSNQTCQDVDLEILPPGEFTIEKEGRGNQMRDLYNWQFA